MLSNIAYTTHSDPDELSSTSLPLFYKYIHFSWSLRQKESDGECETEKAKRVRWQSRLAENKTASKRKKNTQT